MIILGETKAKETFCAVKTFKVRDRVKDKNNELIFFRYKLRKGIKKI